MQSTKTYDFAVIGAGMAGASAAYRLGLSGASVIVLEQESQPGYHSTGRSAAMFMETYGTPHTRALTRASRDFFLNPPPGFTEHAILTPRSVLYIAQAGQEKLLEDAYQAYLNEGLEVQRLSPAQAIERVPCLTPDTLVGAILDTIASDMDVHGLHQGFLRGMREHGVQLLPDTRLEGAQYNQGVWTLHTSTQQTLHARTVVNAAGAWADIIAERCGAAPLGIQPKRRSAFLFAPPENTDISHWPTVLAVDESFYFKPDAGMLLGSPANADPVQPHDVAPEELDIATGIYRIESATSLRIRRPSHVWAGLRSFAPDDEFVIGWDAHTPQFFWLAGQGGYGIQTAAGASELAATLLQRQPLPDTLTRHGVSAAAVDPARFDIAR